MPELSVISEGEMTFIKQVPRRFRITPPKKEELQVDSLQIGKVNKQKIICREMHDTHTHKNNNNNNNNKNLNMKKKMNFTFCWSDFKRALYLCSKARDEARQT